MGQTETSWPLPAWYGVWFRRGPEDAELRFKIVKDILDEFPELRPRVREYLEQTPDLREGGREYYSEPSGNI